MAEQKPVSGMAMLVVTLALVAVMLVLAVLAGPFGRDRPISQEPVASMRQANVGTGFD